MASITLRIDIQQERARLIRFVVLGAANTVFAYAIYAAGLAFGLPFQLASLLALAAGIVSGFFLQGKLAFKAKLEGRFGPFLALWALLYLANIALIGAFALFGVNLYWAGLIAALPVNILSFLALRFLIFAEAQVSPLRLALCWCLGLVAVARLYTVTHLAPNWDEFLNLSMLYDFRRGEMTEIFQTAFIHLFRWLPYISGNEVDQVVAARLVSLLCVAITSWAIYHASRRFMNVDSALVAVLSFNCFGYALLYGTDFRTDTLATAAMMAAAAIATRSQIRYRPVIAVGVLIAIGGALTIKSIFFLPLIAVQILASACHSGDHLRSVKILAAGATASLAVFASILVLHASGLQDQASAMKFLGRTGGATLFTGDFTVLSNYWKPAILGNLGFWVLVLGGLGAVLRSLRGPQPGNKLALIAFGLTALVPVVYSEIYPYYHPFLAAPLAVLAGFGFSRMPGIFRLALMGLLVFSAANAFNQQRNGAMEDQRRTLALVHRLFPEPVPYIDHTSMVSSFPKRGFFMSRWGVTEYRAAGQPVMAEIITREQPKFLLETRDLLAIDRISPELSETSDYGLFKEDVVSLRDNYRRYWGPIFLPGKAISGRGTMELLIAGAYRVETTGRLEIGGRTVQAGDVLNIAAGSYIYSAENPTLLLWAAQSAPDSEPPEHLFTGW